LLIFFLACAQAAKDGSVFMFHACAHNPTGVDPTIEQWKEISALCKTKGHSVFMDSAYQGFASGDADKDAASIRLFVADGNDVCVAQSFAKNVSTLHIACSINWQLFLLRNFFLVDVVVCS
jgi:aspartate aminotransferase